MAGIYIHVPYCKVRCIYCDFFTQVDMTQRSQYIESACKEIELKKDYLNGEKIDTIYLGGGTPSQLTIHELESILNAIYATFEVSSTPEITIEVNPDDINKNYLEGLKTLPINRVSIGIQSLNDNILKFLKRRHSSAQAKSTIIEIQKSGITNISIDLIYGIPNQTESIWSSDLEDIINMNIQHISAYHLIYEEGTKLKDLLDRNMLNPTKEKDSLLFLSRLLDISNRYNFIHYEISNFAKEGYYSKHNSSYWNGAKYLGIGPGAHSYNGESRSYNILSIPEYINHINKGSNFSEIEYLDERTKYNEFILTGMRTMWGVNLEKLRQQFGEEHLIYCLNNVEPHIKSGVVKNENNILKLTREGIFISDGIMSDLMKI